MQLMVYDHDAATGSQAVVGTVNMALTNVFRYGEREAWAPLTRSSDDGGGEAAAGAVHVVAVFAGPPAIAFPQLADPRVMSYTDAERVYKGGAPSRGAPPPMSPLAATAAAAAATATAAEAAASPGGGDDESAAAREARRARRKAERFEERDDGDYDFADDDFDDEAVRRAFAAIDLDHNGMVGFSELRHMLVSMGELVTSEEVTEMLAMISVEHSSVINYDEFYAMAKHPNPSSSRYDPARSVGALRTKRAAAKRADPDATAAAATAAAATATAGGGGDGGLEAASARRAKREACQEVVRSQMLRIPALKQLVAKARSGTFFQRAGGVVSASEMAAVRVHSSRCCLHAPFAPRHAPTTSHPFAQLLGLPSAAREVHLLAAAFAIRTASPDHPDAAGKISFNEVVIGLAGCSEASIETRVRGRSCNMLGPLPYNNRTRARTHTYTHTHIHTHTHAQTTHANSTLMPPTRTPRYAGALHV